MQWIKTVQGSLLNLDSVIIITCSKSEFSGLFKVIAYTKTGEDSIGYDLYGSKDEEEAKKFFHMLTSTLNVLY